MSLATRCPACSTVFRVLQDQLRVSEGWVRCGQCQEVFNALETLFDLGGPTEAGAEVSPPPATFAPPPPEPPQFRPYAPPPATTPPPPAPPPAHIAEEQPEFEPTAPATAAPDDPFNDIDTFTVLDDGDSLGGIIAGGPVPEDDWHSLSPPLPADDQEPPPRSATSPAPSPTPPPSAPTPAERAASFAAPVGGARPPAAPAQAPANEPNDFFSDEVDTVSAAAFEAGVDEEEDAEAPTPSRFIGPMPDWARTPSRQRRSGKKSKAKLPHGDGDGPHAQAHQSGKAHRKRRKPEFVRQAERAALWRRPLVRLTLGAAALALCVLLAGQVGYHYREPLAAQVPALAPALHAGCDWLHCKIGAPRAIERIRLDASDLTRTEQDQVLRFTADLHNTAEYPVRAPALDVSFTDALGRIVSRKVLLPTDLGARSESIAADAQWRIDARLAVGELQVAGYTVEVFYP
ncbi:zinc-ribbon and DUF3426 domain-containing protein [Ideonella sp.]|uniref:zinc-ribbon and DUF3426 domain-containing protein n=1 Tax=Ideonella sp. TaxID=1929293 RepID=UPI0035B054AE